MKNQTTKMPASNHSTAINGGATMMPTPIRSEAIITKRVSPAPLRTAVNIM